MIGRRLSAKCVKLAASQDSIKLMKWLFIESLTWQCDSGLSGKEVD